MFGTLLGYDLCDRCERYRKRKNESGKCSHCKKWEMQIVRIISYYSKKLINFAAPHLIGEAKND